MRVHARVHMNLCVHMHLSAITERVSAGVCIPALALSEINRPTGKATDLSFVIMSLTQRLGPRGLQCYSFDALCKCANTSHAK